jgi:hypothetical protein
VNDTAICEAGKEKDAGAKTSVVRGTPLMGLGKVLFQTSNDLGAASIGDANAEILQREVHNVVVMQLLRPALAAQFQPDAV